MLWWWASVLWIWAGLNEAFSLDEEESRYMHDPLSVLFIRNFCYKGITYRYIHSSSYLHHQIHPFT